MRVYRYWASTEVDRVAPWGAEIRFRVWGGSDLSEADALQHARERAETISPSEDRVEPDTGAYTYHRGMTPEPLLDETLDDRGAREGAITLNRYGARVLNTRSLALVDIDFDTVPHELVDRLAPDQTSSAPPRRGLLARLRDALTPEPGPTPERVRQAVCAHLRGWVGAGADRGARLYATRAGLRVLLVNPPMDPASDETRRFMDACGSDPSYVHLCRVQACFRARLTPKPWRLPRFDEARPKVTYTSFIEDETQQWLMAYANACEGYSVCELLEAMGADTPPTDAAGELIRIHDEETGVGSGLPLA